MAQELIKRRRIFTVKGGLIEYAAWKIPKDANHPEGIKYTFTYVKNGKRKIAIDNYNKEGHHMHYLGEKKPYGFTSLEKAEEDFYKLIKEFENDKDERH